jgi:hypothetical protein
MNRKGVFLTFMVFLLIGAALALNLVLRQSSVREERTMIDESAAKEVNETFNSIYSQILEERAGYAGEVQKRYLVVGAAPSGGGTSFSVSQQVPPKTTVSASDIVDALNLFALFLSNKDISQDLNIVAFVPDAFNAQAWGSGTENPDVGFLIQPYCVRYLPLQVGDRFMGFEVPADWDEPGGGVIWKDWGCAQPFDIANIESIDVNFYIGKPVAPCAEYLAPNPPNCKGTFLTGAPPACRTTAMSPLPLFPEVDVNFLETKVFTDGQASCGFQAPSCVRKFKGYLDYVNEKVNFVWLQLTGGASGGITINFLDKDELDKDRVYLMDYDGHDICLDNNVLVDIKFKGPTWVDLAGFEFAVGKLGFDLCRRTKYGICPGKIACAYEAAEVGELYCGDGKDNDCDGATDCADSGCSTATVCTCPNGTCGAGETYLNCKQDCCENDCTATSDSVCHSACNTFNGCTLATGCDGRAPGYKFCNNGCSYSTCCEVTSTSCGSGKYCSSGNCPSCSSVCNGSCPCSTCYPTDPDCTSTGTKKACCGDGTCNPGETVYNCPADCVYGY